MFKALSPDFDGRIERQRAEAKRLNRAFRSTRRVIPPLYCAVEQTMVARLLRCLKLPLVRPSQAHSLQISQMKSSMWLRRLPWP